MIRKKRNKHEVNETVNECTCLKKKRFEILQIYSSISKKVNRPPPPPPPKKKKKKKKTQNKQQPKNEINNQTSHEA